MLSTGNITEQQLYDVYSQDSLYHMLQLVDCIQMIFSVVIWNQLKKFEQCSPSNTLYFTALFGFHLNVNAEVAICCHRRG